MAKRLKITLEYDGARYVGWQAQDNGPSVQEALEKAIFGFSQEKVRVHGAGRTDAGVHALGQVAHFDLGKKMTPAKVMAALNGHLRGEAISVLSVKAVDKKFEARFSATKRHYLYRILNRRGPPALLRGKVWWVPIKLNAKAMNEAAKVLIGKHDFTTFRSIHCQAATPLKTLDSLEVKKRAEEIHITASARSFLHHQVRSMVGCLKLVGEGKWTKGDLEAALKARDRTALGLNAPPEGLYLTRVDYD